MYYIWTDESDTTGKYYANFYGGILIDSKHYEEVLRKDMAIMSCLDIKLRRQGTRSCIENIKKVKKHQISATGCYCLSY